MTKRSFPAGIAIALRGIALLLVVALLAFAYVMIRDLGGASGLFEALRTGQLRELKPAQLQGAPLRTAHGQRDRVYLLSRQEESLLRVSLRNRDTQRRRQMMHVDLWAIDAATLQLAWRKRIRTFENRQLEGLDLRDIALLGVDGNTLWLNVREPFGVSLADGELIADGERIDARNPTLAGKRVNEPGYIAFGRHGLQLTLDDASQWRVDGTSLEAQGRDTPSAQPERIVGPADRSAASDHFRVRGLPIGDRWLGVLTDDEADRLRGPVLPAAEAAEHPALVQYLAFTHVPQPLTQRPMPYRLWSARVQQVSAAPPDWPPSLPDNWGTRPQFSDYAALPAAPPFLLAGLLREHGQTEQALWYRNPDSVLVLYFDKLGAKGRLKLARVAGPAGGVVWDAVLRLTELAAVMRGPSDLVLLGTEPVHAAVVEVDATNASAEAPTRPSLHERLVRVDIGSGAVTSFDLTSESMAALNQK